MRIGMGINFILIDDEEFFFWFCIYVINYNFLDCIFYIYFCLLIIFILFEIMKYFKIEMWKR